MIVSLLGYFFYAITAFTVIMTFLIGWFDSSTLENVRHYPRPIIVRTATSNAPRQPLVASGAKEQSTAKRVETVVATAKVDVNKRKRERLAHLYKLNVVARQRQNYEARGYLTALGYAEESGYRPGIDTVR